MSLIEELVARSNLLAERNIDAIRQNIKALEAIQASLGMPPAGAIHDDISFTEYEVDVTTAHTDLSITVTQPCHFIQAWCDGITDGISIKIGTQDRPALELSKFVILPVFNPKFVYLTNDVRAGRNRVKLYFVRSSSPLGMYLSGEPAQVSRAELAARLGSIHTFDRRGDVVWFDDFESGIAEWEVSIVGVGDTATLSTARARTGATSCLLTTGSATNPEVAIAHYFPTPVYTGMGVEFSVAFFDQFTDIWFQVVTYDGTDSWFPRIKLDRANDKLQYYDSAGAYQDIATGLLLYHNDYFFRTLKLVYDTSIDEYKRLIYNNQTYDLSGIALRKVAAVGSDPYAFLDIQLTGRTGFTDTAYIDDVIITQNEP